LEDIELDETEMAELYGDRSPPTIQERDGSLTWLLPGQELHAPILPEFLTAESIANQNILIFDPSSRSQTWFMVARGIRVGVFDDWYVILSLEFYY
jgi:hypothetical protein